MGKTDKVASMSLAEGKARLQATVTEEEKQIIEQLAAADDRTASNFVTRIVRKWLDENGHAPTSD